MMRWAQVAAGSLGVCLVWNSSIASAASFDCDARGLTRTEVLICGDSQLLRTDRRLARQADVAARKMNYGQYLGLRHWQAEAARQRNLCETDRACISAHYRAQGRLLDRVQRCLDSRFSRRSCLRNALAGDREAVRR